LEHQITFLWISEGDQFSKKTGQKKIETDQKNEKFGIPKFFNFFGIPNFFFGRPKK
jgi:hypothetical protein